MAEQATAGSSSTRFLSSHNPAQVKRNVLASFTSVLLMPVTIVPRAVGGALMTGGNAAVQGIAMLNPQRWGGGSGAVASGYSRNLELEKGTGTILFEGDEDEDEKVGHKTAASICRFSLLSLNSTLMDPLKRLRRLLLPVSTSHLHPRVAQRPSQPLLHPPPPIVRISSSFCSPSMSPSSSSMLTTRPSSVLRSSRGILGTTGIVSVILSRNSSFLCYRRLAGDTSMLGSDCEFCLQFRSID